MSLRVLELYCGIGGMHYALKETGILGDVAAAVDINTTAISVYKHNFTQTKIINKTIEAINVEEINRLKINMILLSPPCQPYCGVGNKLDIDDERAKSFLHFISILPSLNPAPDYILLENVKGFDISKSRKLFIECLRSLQYCIQEFLLSPLQFGVPNSRLRYYLLAKRSPLTFCFEPSDAIHTSIPPCLQEYLRYVDPSNRTKACEITACIDNDLVQSDPAFDNMPLYTKCADICGKLEEFLDAESEDGCQNLLALPDKFYPRFWVMDFVTPESRNSCCFTKRYGQHLEGAGSLIIKHTDDVKHLNAFKQTREYNDDMCNTIRDIGIRYFSPREICNIMSFPKDFNWPSNLTNRQLFKLLGNSLNVHVVACLIHLLTRGDS